MNHIWHSLSTGPCAPVSNNMSLHITTPTTRIPTPRQTTMFVIEMQNHPDQIYMYNILIDSCDDIY